MSAKKLPITRLRVRVLLRSSASATGFQVEAPRLNLWPSPVASKILDGHIGLHHEGLVHYAVAAVVERDFLVDVGKRETAAHLSPVLHLIVEVEAHCLTLEVRANDDAVLIEDGARNGVIRVVRTTCDTNLVAVHPRGSKNFILPVRAFTQQRGIEVTRVRLQAQVIRNLQLVSGKLREVHHVDGFAHLLIGVEAVVGNFRLAFLASFRGHQYHTVGCSCTINR